MNKELKIISLKEEPTYIDELIVLHNEYDEKNLLNDFESKKSVLVLCGEVQSGKTGHIESIITRAFSNEYKYDYVILLGGTNNNLLEQTITRLKKRLFVKSTFGYSDKEGTLYIVLKEKTNLEKMKDHIQDYIGNKKVLIIDDECDYASINSSSDFKKITMINKLITESFNLLRSNCGGLLQVTATPFANIISDKSELTNFIDYIWSLPSKEKDGYCGLSTFNKENKYLVDVPHWYEYHKLKTNEDIEYNDVENSQIEFATYVWIIQTINYLKKYPNNKSDFLIFSSLEKNDHEKICLQVTRFIERLKLQQVSNYFEHAKKIMQLCSFNEVTKNEFDDFLKNKIQPEIFNGNKSELSDNRFKVIVGGTYLSRGVTFSNLITELFLQSTDSICCDTLLQRCRWFGYRRIKTDNKFEFMNIITTTPIKEAFKKYQEVINLFKYVNGAKLNAKEIKNKLHEWIRKNKGIKLTNESKW